MKKKNKILAIFTLVEHRQKDGKYYGYAPYVSEMNIWTSHFDEVLVVGPFSSSAEVGNLDLAYDHSNLSLIKIPSFHIKSLKGILKLILRLPTIGFKINKVMSYANHLHFRCPSNVSAIAALIQIFYPSKPKSAKYAGNWKPNSKQPIGYRFQKWLLSNTLLTKNMQVLVYGEWPNQTKSVVPFFSATYKVSERVPYQRKDYKKKLKFVFIGAMVVGKRPFLTIDIIKRLLENGFNCELHMFGDGLLINEVKDYIEANHLQDAVVMHGNQNKEVIKQNLKDAHFTILPSKSEGWPKAIAEGMFFGAIPISTKISCLPWILDWGKRGILIDADLDAATETIVEELKKGDTHLASLSKSALEWSQEYTVDRLEKEIDKVLNR
ncbi:MAG: glycosyltransferase family 4 protein [Bacteroidota bacterium]